MDETCNQIHRSLISDSRAYIGTQLSHLAQNRGRESAVERGYASICNHVDSHAEQATFNSLLCLQMHLPGVGEGCVTRTDSVHQRLQ